MTRDSLSYRLALPLDAKVALSQSKIAEWHGGFAGKVYVSFSGGLDSTVLLDLARGQYPDVPAVFCDTGLEFPEIKEFVRSVPGVTWIKPKKSFTEVISQYGFPVVSKEVASCIDQYRRTKNEALRNKRWYGAGKKKVGKIPECWKFLVDAPFKISDQCCYIMKKGPFKIYERATGRKAILGSRAEESSIRLQSYRKFGCNAFDMSRPLSRPLSFWTAGDIREYINIKGLLYSKVYDMGYDRTGCMFCLFGLQREQGQNRFQKMRKTHPRIYQYCMNALGLKEVLEFMGVEYE